MSDDPAAPKHPPRTTSRFGALLLMTIGALMVGLCGACTAGVVADTLLGWRACSNLPPGEECGPAMLASDSAFSIVIALIVGGTPVIIGLFLMRAGWKAWRGAPSHDLQTEGQRMSETRARGRRE